MREQRFLVANNIGKLDQRSRFIETILLSTIKHVVINSATFPGYGGVAANLLPSILGLSQG